MQSALRKLRKADPRIVRQINGWNVFEELRKREHASIPELSAIIGLTPAVITKILLGMVDMGLVKSIGEGQSAGGRKPVLYALEENRHFLLSAEMGLRKLRVALSQLNGKIIATRSFTVPSSTPKAAVSFLGQSVGRLIEECAVQKSSILGFGVAQPGVVDYSGKMVRLDVHKNWREVPLGELIQGELDLPVFLVEEAHARLVGIVDRATGRTPDNLIYLLAGNIDAEGLSGAVMTNGALVGGSSGFAGEMGHMQVDPQGPRCPCGRRGCWEAVGSLDFLEERLGVSLPAGKELLRERLFQRAHQQVLEDFVSVHANGIVNLIHVFNPQTVIVGGELVFLGEQFFTRLFDRVRGAVMEPFGKNLELIVRQDEDDALRGASAVALKEVLTTFNIKGYAYA